MAEKPFRCAIVGCGRISQVHLPVVDQHRDVELVAVADVDADAAKDVAEAWRVDAFNDAEAMIGEVQPDAVIVCTPPNTHRELAIAALRAGAHVLCEKPLALTVDGAVAMQEEAEASKRVLMMASKFRYVPDVVRARSLLRSGLLGRILSFENEFCAPVDMKARWNSSPEIGGGGVLVDNGTHSVDIVRYLLGSIVEVHAVEGVREQSLEVEDSARVLCRVEDGIVASIELSWSIDKLNPWYISVYGSEGVLRVGWKGSHYRLRGKKDWVPFGSGYDKFDAVRFQLDNFLASIHGMEEPLISSDAAADSVRVIQAAYRSYESRAWESVIP